MKITLKGRAIKRRRIKQKAKGPYKMIINSIACETFLWNKIDRISRKNKISRNAVIRQILQSYKG